MEMELAKCKIDIMSLNSQLLDAIQQKLNLSQQLEAWQVGQRSRVKLHFFSSFLVTLLNLNAQLTAGGVWWSVFYVQHLGCGCVCVPVDITRYLS